MTSNVKLDFDFNKDQTDNRLEEGINTVTTTKVAVTISSTLFIGVDVAQGIERLSNNQKGQWFDPRLPWSAFRWHHCVNVISDVRLACECDVV